MSETDGSTFILTFRHNMSWDGYFFQENEGAGVQIVEKAQARFMHAVQLQMQSKAV